MQALKILSAAVVAGLMMTSAASAKPVMQDNAIDKYGNPIWDARGNCVLTKWESASGKCGKRLRVAREDRTVYFDFNKSNIKASEKTKLDSLVKRIKASKEVESVDIVGHADQIGTNGYNQKLSMKRAQSVKSYLAGKGVKTRKIDVRAVGESQPVTKCDASLSRKELISCLAEDRRVELELNYVK